MRFLIVDDHAMIREGLKRTLDVEFPGSHILAASSAAEALAALDAEGGQVVILDLSLTGRDGLTVLVDPDIRVSERWVDRDLAPALSGVGATEHALADGHRDLAIG